MLKYIYMQPNYFYGATQPQNKANYQYQQSSNNPEPKPSKTHIVIYILLSLVIASLIVYILVDKLIFTKSVVTTVEDSNTRADMIPLTDIEKSGVELKDALAGRIFTVDSTYHQYIKFTSNEKYEFHYWRKPGEDPYYLVPSIDNGKFTVEGTTIKLSSGDAFKVVHNYLVKTASSLSNNDNTIYFDNYSLPQTSQLFDEALTAYIEKIRKADPNLAKVELARVSFDYLTCSADQKQISDPDNDFICVGNYAYYFNTTSTNKLIEENPDYHNFHDIIIHEEDYRRFSFNHIYTDTALAAIYNRSPFTIHVNTDHSFRVTNIKDDYKLEHTDDIE